MNFEQVSYLDEDGSLGRAILADSREINIMGRSYLHGKECNRYGLKLRAPKEYELRHLAGDGMVWRLIPTTSIVDRKPMNFYKDRLEFDDGSRELSAVDPIDAGPEPYPEPSYYDF